MSGSSVLARPSRSGTNSASHRFHFAFALDPGLEHPVVGQLTHVGEVQLAAIAVVDHLRGDPGRLAGDDRAGAATIGAIADAAADRVAGDGGDDQHRGGEADHGPQPHRAGAEPAQPAAEATRRARLGRRHRSARGAAARSASTSAISRARSSGGGSTRSTVSGSACTAGASQRISWRQRSQPSAWRSSAAASLGLERPQHVGGDVLAPALVVRLAHANPSASSPRIFSRPSRIRPFTVPSGTPSIRAISDWLKPPK